MCMVPFHCLITFFPPFDCNGPIPMFFVQIRFVWSHYCVFVFYPCVGSYSHVLCSVMCQASFHCLASFPGCQVPFHRVISLYVLLHSTVLGTIPVFTPIVFFCHFHVSSHVSDPIPFLCSSILMHLVTFLLVWSHFHVSGPNPMYLVPFP